MKIGIDIDGVIGDFVSNFIEIINKKNKKKLREEDIRQHDLFQVLGIKFKESLKIIQETLKSNIQPYPNAKEFINKLYSKHEIIIITARGDKYEDITRNWFKQHGIKYHKVHFLKEGDKHLIDEKIDLIIEDCLEDAIGWIGNCEKILIYDHPWNQSIDLNENFTRVQNWLEIFNYIKHVRN